jgi:hypothetical protein
MSAPIDPITSAWSNRTRPDRGADMCPVRMHSKLAPPRTGPGCRPPLPYRRMSGHCLIYHPAAYRPMFRSGAVSRSPLPRRLDAADQRGRGGCSTSTDEPACRVGKAQATVAPPGGNRWRTRNFYMTRPNVPTKFSRKIPLQYITNSEYNRRHWALGGWC